MVSLELAVHEHPSIRTLPIPQQFPLRQFLLRVRNQTRHLGPCVHLIRTMK